MAPATRTSELVQVVAVANVAPSVTAPANQAADEGAAKSVNLGSFTDPGPDSPVGGRRRLGRWLDPYDV